MQDIKVTKDHIVKNKHKLKFISAKPRDRNKIGFEKYKNNVYLFEGSIWEI